jgi:hypothetical protein
MSCYYCAQEGFRMQDQGNCVHCQVAVCVDPSGRYDNAFHGEACVCGCGRLTCEKHLIEHVRNAHSREDGAMCFPALWIAIGGGGIQGGAAIAMRPDRSTPEARHQVTRFLNVVRPGHRALRALAARLPGVAREWSEGWGTPEEPKVVFHAEFFSAAVAETVVAHAADAVGAAAEPLMARSGVPAEMESLAGALDVDFDHLRFALHALVRWRREGGRLESEALHAWLPRDAGPGIASHLARMIEMRRPATGDPERLVRELLMEYRASDSAPGVVVEESGWPAEAKEPFGLDEGQSPHDRPVA